jgi:RHS repeat-associated protein
VTQNAQSSSNQARAYWYDGLGRITQELNPETGSGMTVYTYDSDSTCGTSKGDLVKKQDQVGDVICYTYDAMHRLTSAYVPSGSYASSSAYKYLIYDSATVNSVSMSNTKARLAEAYTSSSSCPAPCSSKITDEGFSYDARGEATDVYESTPHSGGYFHMNQTYWANGVTNAPVGTNPSGTNQYTAAYGLDGEGRVTSAGYPAGSTNFLTSTTYNAASEPLQVNFASGDSDAFAYDPSSFRMTQYKFGVNGQSVVGNLTWNSNASLQKLAITDPFNSANRQTCNYTYDDLSRVASASCGSAFSGTYSYDAFGNLQKSGTFMFQPTYNSGTNQMTSIGGQTPTYDANGNVKNDFLNTYAWDAYGRPVTVDTVAVTYDAMGRMVEQNRSGAYTQIYYSPSGFKMLYMNGSAFVKDTVPLSGGTAEWWTPTTTYYRHSDWLGSSRLASTTTRTIYYDGAYGPFGEQYAQTGTTDLNFTGMNQDTASNVYDFPAREYGIQGRWPSPDPAGVASVQLNDPQSLNRYGYVRNTPLYLFDPTGMEDCSEVRLHRHGASRSRIHAADMYDDGCGGTGGGGEGDMGGGDEGGGGGGDIGGGDDGGGDNGGGVNGGGCSDPSCGGDPSCNDASCQPDNPNQPDPSACQDNGDCVDQQPNGPDQTSTCDNSSDCSDQQSNGLYQTSTCSDPSCIGNLPMNTNPVVNDTGFSQSQTSQQQGNSWTHPLTPPTCHQWGVWAATDATVSFVTSGGGKWWNPFSAVFGAAAVFEGMVYAAYCQ